MVWDCNPPKFEMYIKLGVEFSTPKVSAERVENEVTGILSDEEIRRVEEIHSEHFAWEKRRWRLLEVIRGAFCP